MAKVTLCHWANGNPHEITISENAADTHLIWHHETGWQPAPGHEQDSIGACPTPEVSTSTSTSTTTSPPSVTPTTLTTVESSTSTSSTTTPASGTSTSTSQPPSTETFVSVPGNPSGHQPLTELPATGIEGGMLMTVGIILTSVGLVLRRFGK